MKITQDEHTSAQLLHIKKGSIRALIIFPCIIIFVSFYFQHNSLWTLSLAVLGALTGYAAVYLLTYWNIRKAFVKHAALHENYETSWDTEKYSVKGETGLSETPWSYYILWKENSKVFLLYHSKNLFQIVPKKIFSDNQEMEDFRSHLKKHSKEG